MYIYNKTFTHTLYLHIFTGVRVEESFIHKLLEQIPKKVGSCQISQYHNKKFF